MRITVGGVLIVAGAAAAGYLAADKAHLNWVKDKTLDLTKQGASLIGLYKAGETPKPPDQVYSPPPPFPVGVANSSSPVSGVSTSTEPVGLPNASQPIASAATATEVAVTESPAPKVTKKKRRSRRKGKRLVKKNIVANPTAASTVVPTVKKTRRPVKAKTAAAASTQANGSDSGTQKLIGTYVSLELITGRSVQGILQAKTATHYKLNVPGLGPLDYPLENVRSINSAQ